MCGIAGYVGTGDEVSLRRMVAAVRHRGPDHEAVFVGDAVGLAHARLSVIDTSSAAHQPMFLPDKSLAIVFNGEIYNFKSLRSDLEARGCNFRTTSDTEVILWLYALDGDAAFEKMIGMFAIAIYDFKSSKLLLVRDRMGEKPLYWSIQKGTLFFASELGALMKSGAVVPRISMPALAQYLASDYVPTPHSLIEGVYKLEPASILTYEKGQVNKRVYWEPQRTERIESEADALRRLDHLLTQSVAGQLVSDVPLGVFLSGGIDSSTVAYFAARASSQTINTFSIGFDDASFDESAYARRVADHIGVKHHEERLSARATLDLIPEIPTVLSEPIADASILPTMLLSRFARKSVTVALGGDGGDELFAGYPTFGADTPFALFRALPPSVRAAIRSSVNLLPTPHANFSFSYNLKKLISTDERLGGRRHTAWLGTFGPNELLRLMPGASGDVYAHVDRYAGGGGGNDLLWMYARTYLMDQVLVKVDRGSMRYALETRAPMLDHRLVEYVFSLPYELKYRRGTNKYLLKKLMRGKLPDSIIDRKKKGFGIPLARWLVGPLKELCTDLLSPDRLRGQGLFDPTVVSRLVDDHMMLRRDNRKELWNLMVFQLWYDRWMR